MQKGAIQMGQLSVLHWMLFGAGVYCLICGGFGAYVAHQKCRSGLEGFLFGAVLGPIGVVAVGTLPTIKKSPSAAEEDDEQQEDNIGQRIAEQYQSRPRKLSGESAERRPKGGG